MKKKINYIIEVLIATIFIMIAILILDNVLGEKESITKEENKDNISNNVYDTVDEGQISKALAMKMIALGKEDKNIIRTMDREIDYKDTNKNDWYDKYFNLAIIEGWYKPSGDYLKPLEPMTYGETEELLEYFKVDYNNENVDFTKKEEPIKYLEWIEIYKKIIAETEDVESHRTDNLYIFSTPSISSELSAWEVATDKGKYSFEGLSLDSYIDKEIIVGIKDNEILYVKEISTEKPTLKNAYIKEGNFKNKNINVFMGGVSREFLYDINNKVENGIIADIKIDDDTITSIFTKDIIETGVVRKISKEKIYIEGKGEFSINADAKFYSTITELAFVDYKSVIVGYDTANVVFDKDNNLCAIVINKKAPIDFIRVLINNSGYTDVIHKELQLVSNTEYEIEINNKITKFEKSESVNFGDINLNVGQVAKVKTSNSNKIKVLTISRGWGDSKFNPEYRGILEVEKTEDGYTLINEVDFEEYLYSVVPSEMPSSYGLEAAKVQAICARSYAYAQFYANRYSDYGAHVDDSTSCQVYNNVHETDNSIKAVNETKGMYLSYNGNIISANFFSTSCGVTANSGEVWGNYTTMEFPTSSPNYLQSKYQYDEGEINYNLSKEDDFREFIENGNLKTFDSDFSWYRWEVTMNVEQIQASINKEIANRYETAPKYIKTLDKNDIFRSREIEGIGELMDIFVYSRGGSGIITELVITGTKGIYKIATEYNIRKLLAPINYVQNGKEIAIKRINGEKTYNMSLLPSAFFVMNKSYDDTNKLESVTFYGGGYGHGVGMSQNGVKGMVEKGYNFAQILDHYYEGTSIIKLDQ